MNHRDMKILSYEFVWRVQWSMFILLLWYRTIDIYFIFLSSHTTIYKIKPFIATSEHVKAHLCVISSRDWQWHRRFDLIETQLNGSRSNPLTNENDLTSLNLKGPGLSIQIPIYMSISGPSYGNSINVVRHYHQ